MRESRSISAPCVHRSVLHLNILKENLTGIQNYAEYAGSTSTAIWTKINGIRPGKNAEAKHCLKSERAFTQNGFQHVTDSKKSIVVEFEGNISKYPYETNKIIKIKDNGAYFAICEKDDLPYLFVSKSFTYNDKVVRSSYIGLTPEVFYVAMAIIPPYEVEDISGNTYKIWIE